MDFTSEQELLRDSVRRTCVRHGGTDVVRKYENDPLGYPPALWAAFGELGLHGLVIDEEHGGSGMTMVDAAIVYEELGRALAPTPHFVSCLLAAGAIGRLGDSAQRERWLPRIASGESVVTIAWLEAGGGFGQAGINVVARSDGDGDGYRLDGVKWHVPYARAAETLLVLARADDDLVLALVDTAADGVQLEQ